MPDAAALCASTPAGRGSQLGFCRLFGVRLAGSRPVFEENKDQKKAGDFSDVTDFGIDRSNPEYAPFMGNHTWKEAAYPNMADHSWKGWEDLPAPYKYYEVKVNPADVENKGFFWDLMTNWKTAIPFTIGVSIPVFAYDVRGRNSVACGVWEAMALLRGHNLSLDDS